MKSEPQSPLRIQHIATESRKTLEFLQHLLHLYDWPYGAGFKRMSIWRNIDRNCRILKMKNTGCRRPRGSLDHLAELPRIRRTFRAGEAHPQILAFRFLRLFVLLLFLSTPTGLVIEMYFRGVSGRPPTGASDPRHLLAPIHVPPKFF